MIKKLLLAGTLLVFSSSVVFANPCAPSFPLVTKKLISFLEKRGEVLDSRGAIMLADGQTPDPRRIIQKFLSKTGDYTIVVSYINGVSCLIVSGKGWTKVKRKKIQKGRES